jgi:LysM repeat protein
MKIGSREKKYRGRPVAPQRRKEMLKGVAVPPTEALVTVKGHKVHFRQQETYTVEKGDSPESISEKLNIPVKELKRWNRIDQRRSPTLVVGEKLSITPPISIFGVCGAGSPNQEFPVGSVTFFDQGNYDPATGDPQFVVVTCYKCLKIRYMNLYKKEGIAGKIPERTFTPTDKRPTPTGQNVGLSKIIDRLKSAPKSVRRIELRQDTIIVFLRTKSEGKRDRIYATNIKPAQMKGLPSFIEKKNIPFRTVQMADPSIYNRRKEHVMIPFGRYGAFGGNNKAFGKKGEEKTTADIVMGTTYRITENQFFTKKGDISVKWVQNYFQRNQAKLTKKWEVGPKEARTQQYAPDPTQQFLLSAINLLQLQGYTQLSAKDAVRAQKLVALMVEFGEYLYTLPISQVRALMFKSYNANAIKRIVVQRKQGEGKRSNPKERVPHLLEKMHKFDTMLSELEGADAQSGRSSFGKR